MRQIYLYRVICILCNHLNFLLQSKFFYVRNLAKIILYVCDEWAVAHFFFPRRHKNRKNERYYKQIPGRDPEAR